MYADIKNILLIDDDTDDAELFEFVLEEIHPDYRLTIAKYTPGDPNDLACFAVPDLIVLDINMPYKSGEAWLTEIRSLEQYNAVPIVILSGHQNPANIQRCIAMGADKYYIKPATLTEIRAMVAEICGITKGIFAN